MRAFVVIWRLLPFILAFLRDRRRWIVVGGPTRRSLAEHQRRADRLVDTLAGLGPTFIGWLSDVLEPSVGVQSLRYALLISTLFNIWSAVHYMLAARTLRHELTVAEAVDQK